MSNKSRVLEIAELVMEINETTEHHVFMDISPHVEGLYIQVHYGGWKRDAETDQRMCIYYEYEEECEDAKKQLLTLLESEGGRRVLISENVEREIEINETMATIANQLEGLIQKYVDIIAGKDQELDEIYEAMDMQDEALEEKEDHIRNLEDLVNELKDEIQRMEEAAGIYPAWTRR